jgi:hypothetical protein
MMDMPVELQPQLINLTTDELSEIEAWFTNLPIYDEEVRRLIANNVDALSQELDRFRRVNI